MAQQVEVNVADASLLGDEPEALGHLVGIEGTPAITVTEHIAIRHGRSPSLLPCLLCPKFLNQVGPK